MLEVDNQRKKANNRQRRNRGKNGCLKVLALFIAAALALSCRSVNRDQYFSSLRSQHAGAMRDSIKDETLNHFDGLVQIIMNAADRQTLAELIDAEVLPQFAALTEHGVYVADAPHRFSDSNGIVGVHIPASQPTSTFEFEPYQLNSLYLNFTSPNEHCANAPANLTITSANWKTVRRDQLICLDPTQIATVKEQRKIDMATTDIAHYVLNDLLTREFLKLLPYKNPLILVFFATPVAPTLAVRMDHAGHILGEDLLPLTAAIRDLENQSKGFLPIKIRSADGTARPSFAEIVQLQADQQSLPEILQNYLGPGYLLVPYDNHAKARHLLQNLIVQNNLGRRSRIQFDYGRLLRLHHRALTPIGALDLVELGKYQFRYYSEEEWLLLSLKEKNPKLELVPLFANLMLEMPEIDAGFYLNREPQEENSIFLVTSTTAFAEKTRSDLQFIPTLRNINRLLARWIFNKKNQDLTILGEQQQ